MVNQKTPTNAEHLIYKRATIRNRYSWRNKVRWIRQDSEPP